jgi:hypothetical protein
MAENAKSYSRLKIIAEFKKKSAKTSLKEKKSTRASQDGRTFRGVKSGGKNRVQTGRRWCKHEIGSSLEAELFQLECAFRSLQKSDSVVRK